MQASVTDASQNVGTADQALTVDVTAPVVSINGGADDGHEGHHAVDLGNHRRGCGHAW